MCNVAAGTPMTHGEVLDPTTGNPVGATISHGQVYAILWSLYMALAAERDAAIIEEPPPGDFRDRFGED